MLVEENSFSTKDLLAEGEILYHTKNYIKTNYTILCVVIVVEKFPSVLAPCLSYCCAHFSVEMLFCDRIPLPPLHPIKADLCFLSPLEND